MTLVEFLLARIDEDETAVSSGWSRGVLDPAASQIENRWTAPRLLAECEAKRRIVETFTAALAQDTDSAYSHVPELVETVLRLMARPYAEHPDYDTAWN